MTEFNPKGEEVLRRETIESYGFDENDETHQPIIAKIVADRLKDETMKASLHSQKTKAKKEAKDYLKAKEYYKKGGQPKGAKDPKGENKNQDIDTLVAEKVYLTMGGTNTEIRQIRKIMAATGKKFDQAKKDGLFLAWKEKNDKEIKGKKAQLPPSRGGTSFSKEEPKTDKDKEFLDAMGVKEKK